MKSSVLTNIAHLMSQEFTSMCTRPICINQITFPLGCICCCCSVAQSRPALCDTMGCSPSGSCVCGVLQARILGGLPCPSPGDLPDPGIEPVSPALQADSLPSEPPGKPSWMYITTSKVANIYRKACCVFPLCLWAVGWCF